MPTRTRTPRTTTSKNAVASSSNAPVFSEAPAAVKKTTVRRTSKAKAPVKEVAAAPEEKAAEVVNIPTARKSNRRVAAPVEVRKPAKGAWAIALNLAGGDVARLSVNADGSVLVRNKA